MADPSLGGFQVFIQDIMQVPSTALDLNAPIVGYCYNDSINQVWPGLAGLPNRGLGLSKYAQAVYNLAGDSLCNWALDDPNAPIYKDGLQYWAYTQGQYGLGDYVAGILTSTSDVSTSVGYQLPGFYEKLTLANMENLRTPWGRKYISIVQPLGSVANWGIN